MDKTGEFMKQLRSAGGNPSSSGRMLNSIRLLPKAEKESRNFFDKIAFGEEDRDANVGDFTRNPLPLPHIFGSEEEFGPKPNPYYEFRLTPEEEYQEQIMNAGADDEILISLIDHLDPNNGFGKYIDEDANWKPDWQQYMVSTPGEKYSAYDGYFSESLRIKVLSGAFKENIKAPDDQQSFPSDVNFGIDLQIAAARVRRETPNKAIDYLEPPDIKYDYVLISNIINEETREAIRYAHRHMGIDERMIDPKDDSYRFKRDESNPRRLKALRGILGTPLLSVILRQLTDYHNAYGNRQIVEIHIKFFAEWYREEDRDPSTGDLPYTDDDGWREYDPQDGSFLGDWSLGLVLGDGE